MGKNNGLLVLVGLCAAGLAASTNIGFSQGFYLNAGAGVAIAEDVDVENFGIAPPSGTKVEFDPGVRLSLAGGYNFNEYFGTELESGFLYNSVKRVGGVSDVDASLSHVPMLANLVFRCDRPDSNWVPFFGGGAGGDVSILTIDDSAGLDGSEADFNFAWQAFAGLRYKLTENMSIGGSYKFYSVDKASWDVESGGSTFSDAIRIGWANTHNVMIDFNLKF